MANVAHASLTGTELHEPKGVENANAGEVYVANGTGSGAWASVGTSSFTGAIADFVTPIVPDGWLECDGSDINTSTFSALYSVMTIQLTGSRSNGSATITSLSSTANLRVGYYAFGVGISAGTTILSIDSASQVTLSGNAGSTGSALVVFSPWYLNNSTIRLPNISGAGRYRRSRMSTTSVGQLQADDTKTHNHTFTTSTSANGDHSHSVTVSGTLYGGSDAQGSHNHRAGDAVLSGGGVGGAGLRTWTNSGVAEGLTSTDGLHAHNVSVSGALGGSTNAVGNHAHTVSGTTTSTGGAETRPVSIVVLTCVKT